MPTRMTASNRRDRESTSVRLTVSGAKISPVEPHAAEEFLTRLGETTPQGLDVAFGAREDNGTLIGVAVLAPAGHWGTGLVAVQPARRRLRIGRDLLHELLVHAAARELRYVTCNRPLPSTVADEFLRSVGLQVTRDELHGTARILVVVPSPT